MFRKRYNFQYCSVILVHEIEQWRYVHTALDEFSTGWQFLNGPV